MSYYYFNNLYTLKIMSITLSCPRYIALLDEVLCESIMSGRPMDYTDVIHPIDKRTQVIRYDADKVAAFISNELGVSANIHLIKMFVELTYPIFLDRGQNFLLLLYSNSLDITLSTTAKGTRINALFSINLKGFDVNLLTLSRILTLSKNGL
mgnify:CR=1 FL=1